VRNAASTYASIFRGITALHFYGLPTKGMTLSTRTGLVQCTDLIGGPIQPLGIYLHPPARALGNLHLADAGDRVIGIDAILPGVVQIGRAAVRERGGQYG